jgi:hypothetical protein
MSQELVPMMVLEETGWEFVEDADGDFIKSLPLRTILYFKQSAQTTENLTKEKS